MNSLTVQEQGTRLGGNPMANRRHITVDNIARVIYIQVMYTLQGAIKHQEYYDLVNGQWHNYVPKDLVQQFRDAIAGGFVVRPILVNGMCNEEYYIEQIFDLKPANSLLTAL